MPRQRQPFVGGAACIWSAVSHDGDTAGQDADFGSLVMLVRLDIAPVFADDHLLLLDKPAGMLSVPGRGADKQDCLLHRAQRQWPDALTVHRLDMATSGLLLMGRGAAMQRRLSVAFAERRVAKCYVAVVHGVLAAEQGLIDLPVGADWPRRPRQKVDAEHGKPAQTRWRVLARDADTTRLALKPLTGRTHQLRVHLAHLGHPIVGDALYGSDSAPRLLLHASHLAFDHPASGQPLRFDAGPPF